MKTLNLTKNTKLLAVLLSALLCLLSGCLNASYYVVKCDSGFETKPSSHAYSDDGVVYWRADNISGNYYHSRKMLMGESCLTTKVKNAI